MTSIPVNEQLQLLKGMTVRTGAIHEAQILQLKTWPILIPNVVSSKVVIDVESKSVKFLCKSNTSKVTKMTKLTCQNISEWTRNILWNETNVMVYINQKKVFDTKSR